MALPKPEGVAADPFKSAKWDELARGRRFRPSDAPTLALLVQWHAVLQRCIDDLDVNAGQLVFQNDVGDLKPFPQIAIMKQASAEIRQPNKQLGIADAAEGEVRDGGSVLELVRGRRKDRRARAAS